MFGNLRFITIFGKFLYQISQTYQHIVPTIFSTSYDPQQIYFPVKISVLNIQAWQFDKKKIKIDFLNNQNTLGIFCCRMSRLSFRAVALGIGSCVRFLYRFVT